MRIRSCLFSLVLFAVFSANAQVANPSVYLKAGIPAVNREWAGSDYVRTLQVLSSGAVPLPYYSDREGAELLNRLTATENLSFHRHRSLPVGARLGDWINLFQSTNSLMKMYYASSPDGRKQHAEIARLLAFSLYVASEGLNLVDEFLPTVPRDGQYAGRMAGLRQMKSGLTSVFVGLEGALTEDNGLTADDKSVLLDAMALTLPRLKTVFTPEYKFELRKKLQADRALFKNANDVARIDSMIHELGS